MKTKNRETAANPLPICILGMNELALFLGGKLALAGHEVTFLGNPRYLETFGRQDIILKEERSLHSRRFRPQTSWHIQTPPRFLLICSALGNLRADLSLLSPSKLCGALALNFSLMENTTSLTEFLRTPVIQAYYHGFLSCEKNLLTIFTPDAPLSVNLPSANEHLRSLREIFSLLPAAVISETRTPEAFWKFFIPHALNALLPAAYNKSILNLSRDEKFRLQIDHCMEELLSLAAAEEVTLDPVTLLRVVYSAPASYHGTVAPALNRGDKSALNDLAGIIQQKAANCRAAIPELRLLLKSVFDKSLA